MNCDCDEAAVVAAGLHLQHPPEGLSPQPSENGSPERDTNGYKNHIFIFRLSLKATRATIP